MKAPQACESIEEVRTAIDELDAEIIAALGQRFEYVKTIMRFKQNEEQVRAPDRYEAVVRQRRAWAEEAGLDPAVVEAIYCTLIDYFIAHELDDLRQNGERMP